MEVKKDSEELFDMYLQRVEKGKEIVENHIKGGLSQVTLVVPQNDEELNTVLLKRLNLLEKNYEYIQFLCVGRIGDINNYIRIQFDEKILTEVDMDCVLRYASMMNISSLKIISLAKPSSQKAERLIGYKDINLDMIVMRSLLGVMEGE